MNKSDNIANLMLALSKFQGECQDVFKSKKGYGYSYADLAGVLDMVRPLCAKYELAVSQLCTNEANAVSVGVETLLSHSSGEWISSALYMPVTASKGMSAAQAAGSVITYARRYALAAILGIAQTDNDASTKGETKDDPCRQLYALIDDQQLEDRIPVWCEYFKVEKLTQLSDEQIEKIIVKIKENK